MDYFQLLLGIAAILLAIHYYYSSAYNTWKNRGVPGPKPLMFFGNFVDLLLKRQAIATIVKNLYNEYRSEPVFGIYEGTSPILVINDLDLIKDVLIKDFSLFMDRGFEVLEKVFPLLIALRNNIIENRFIQLISCKKHLEFKDKRDVLEIIILNNCKTSRNQSVCKFIDI